MSVSEVRKQILDILAALELITAEQSNRLLEEPTGDLKLAELGIDSMKIVDLCLGLEEQIGREVSVEELIENPTVNKLADHFARERV
jgi:acyl carrier protein